MQNLTLLQTLTMTSREIAELTGKQHAHVMRDIRAMLDTLSQNPNLDFACESTTYFAETGRAYPQYELDKAATLCLVAGYDAVVRMRIINRWMELEAAIPQMTELDMIAAIAARAAAQEKQLAVHDSQLLTHQQQIERLQSDNEALRQQVRILEEEQDYYTMKGYNILHDLRYSRAELATLSKQVKKLSGALGYEVKRKKDTEYGEVNAYHVAVLDQFFNK